jgi:hypothetical protein
MPCHPLSADVTPQCAIRETPAEEPSRDGATSDPERQKVGFTDMPFLFQRHRPHRAIHWGTPSCSDDSSSHWGNPNCNDERTCRRNEGDA